MLKFLFIFLAHIFSSFFLYKPLIFKGGGGGEGGARGEGAGGGEGGGLTGGPSLYAAAI